VIRGTQCKLPRQVPHAVGEAVVVRALSTPRRAGSIGFTSYCATLKGEISLELPEVIARTWLSLSQSVALGRTETSSPASRSDHQSRLDCRFRPTQATASRGCTSLPGKSRTPDRTARRGKQAVSESLIDVVEKVHGAETECAQVRSRGCASLGPGRPRRARPRQIAGFWGAKHATRRILE
jgi:hypothetical protein